MNRYFTTMFAAGAVTAAALGLANVANAAPSGPSRAEETVKALEADGYNVIVNRTGAGPLSTCSVRSVQPGQTYSTVDSRGGSSPAITVISKTVHVDLLC
jgi:hypothetical protein